MKPKQSTLMVFIDTNLKKKMRDYYAKTEKSLRLQVTEALTLYFDRIKKNKEGWAVNGKI